RKEHVSYACHVGGAFAGIGIAIVLRATRLPKPAEADDVEEDRASLWPEGKASAAFFVLSLVGAVVLTAGAAFLADGLQGIVTKRKTVAYRAEVTGARDPNTFTTEA